MATELVTYTSENRIGLITINRADKMNALSNGLVAELRDTMIRFQESDDRVGIVTGAGDKAFSVGADIKDPPRDPELWECMPGVGVDVDKPLIAAVAGHCVGGAYVLVQLCDLAVAAENANFFYPESQLGFCGGLIAGCAARLPHKIAMEFMLTGKRFDAQRAYEVGLVNRVVAAGELLEAAKDLVRRIASKAPLAVAMSLNALRSADLPQAQGLQLEAALFGQACGTDDFREGVHAFLNKQKPEFSGR